MAAVVATFCACDTARTGPDRTPCEQYVGLLRRCAGDRVAAQTQASLELALADPARGERAASTCAVQRERLARACR